MTNMPPLTAPIARAERDDSARLRVVYPIVGALLGLSIEAGLLLVRLFETHANLSIGSLRTEIASGASTYLYLSIVLTGSLALLGSMMGRKEDALRVTSVTDSLTHVINRRGFDAALSTEVTRAVAAGMPLSLLLIDVDHFKLLNDEHGHKMGDLALRVVADVLRVTCRSRDLPARFGGDEFVVLAPRTTGEEASILADRIRVALATLPSTSEIGRPISVSIGVADLDATRIRTPNALLEAADRALYRAKTAGRGCVVRLPSLVDGDVDHDDEETITKSIRCTPPSDPCAEDSNLSPVLSLERLSCAANTNVGFSESEAPRAFSSAPVSAPRNSEIRPLAKTHGAADFDRAQET